MDIAVTDIFPQRTVRGQIGVKVLFTSAVEDAMMDESASVEVYVEASDSYTELRKRAVEKAREFLNKALAAGSSEIVSS